MKMDWQRNAYIIGIFVLGFLLLLEWNQFSTEQKNEINQQQSVAVTTIPSNGIVSEETVAAQTDESTSDLPGVAPSTQNTVPVTESAPINDNRLIHVVTDSFDIQIDKFGGDIVKVALPKHKLRLGKEEAYTLLNRTNQSIYVAESGIIGNNATDKSSTKRPLFSSLQNEYVMEDGTDTLTVDLKYQQDGALITKRFTFTRSDYLIDVRYIIDNKASTDWKGGLYGQIRRDSKEPISTSDQGIGVSPFLGAATTTPDTNYKKLNFSDLADKTEKFTMSGGWVAMVQHYFVSAWIPNKDTDNQFLLRRLGNKDLYLMSFSTPQVTIPAGEQGELSASFYVGPKDVNRLEGIAEYLDLTIDFGWLWWIAKPLFQLLLNIDQFVGNWGWSIIILTLIIKTIFFYPSAISYRSMAKMRKLAPKMKSLKDSYGDDRQKMSQEMMKLYKTEKVNPMGGCLPILIQMPVFIALYWVLMEAVELRHAPFLLWISDLSVKDPYFILPIIMGATMFIQQQLNPTPPDPMQAKIMKWMPVAFTFMFLWFPAGLVLYWVTNNTLSIIQQYVITRRIEAEG